MAWHVRAITGSGNTVLVSNLCNELFAEAAPDTRKEKDRAIDEEIVRRCLEAADKTGQREFDLWWDFS